MSRVKSPLDRPALQYLVFRVRTSVLNTGHIDNSVSRTLSLGCFKITGMKPQLHNRTHKNDGLGP